MVVVLQQNVSSNVQLVCLGLLTYQLNLEMLTNSGRLMLPHNKNRYKVLRNNENLKFSFKDNRSSYKITLVSYGTFMLESSPDPLTRTSRQILISSVLKPLADKW